MYSSKLMTSTKSHSRVKVASWKCNTFRDWRKSLAKNFVAPEESKTVPQNSLVNNRRPRSLITSKFDSMIQTFESINEFDIAAINDYEFRTILSGVKKGLTVSEVEYAFRVLYEDFLPIRIGGDAIFRTLVDRLESQAKLHPGELRSTEAAAVAGEGANLQRLHAVFTAADRDGSGELDREEARELLLALRDMGGGSGAAARGDVDSLFRALDADGSGQITFAEFVRGAQDLLARPGPEQDAALDRLIRVWTASASSSAALRPPPPQPAAAAAPAPARPGARSASEDASWRRFDEMLARFAQWEAAGLGSRSGGGGNDGGEGRMEAVLQGCLVGARTPEVVEALRMVYVRYGVLRMAGDLIFQLMERLVRKK